MYNTILKEKDKIPNLIDVIISKIEPKSLIIINQNLIMVYTMHCYVLKHSIKKLYYFIFEYQNLNILLDNLV